MRRASFSLAARITISIGLVEAYALNCSATSLLGNISTRGLVGIGDHALIGGFIAGPPSGAPTSVVLRAIGPSLQSKGIQNFLADPTLELHDGQGNLLASDDNWKDHQQSDIQSSGLAPLHRNRPGQKRHHRRRTGRDLQHPLSAQR
jgi:hypothetical protein